MTVPHRGKGWQLAPSLIAMEAEADRIAPRRKRASDGSIGDAAHAARASDHNPSGGYVHALDLTHDPAGGFDAHARVRTLVTRRDPRVKYIISNRRIYGPGSRFGWAGGPYTGANPHTQHAHVSIQHTVQARHTKTPWFSAVPSFPTPPIVQPPTVPTPEPPPPPPPEYTDMAAEILVVNDPTHPRHGETWEFFPDRTRRRVPKAGNRDGLITVAALAWGRKIFTTDLQSREVLNVLFERYTDITPRGD